MACGPGSNDTVGGSSASNSSKSSGASFTIELDIEPQTVGTASVRVVAHDGGEPVTGAVVAVRGDMTHAGMAPALGSLQETEPGVYTTDSFVLGMAGDWLVTVEVAAADGRKAKSESFVTVGSR